MLVRREYDRVLEVCVSRGLKCRNGAFHPSIDALTFQCHLNQCDVLAQRLDSFRSLAVDVEHDRQRRWSRGERRLKELEIRERIASAHRYRVKRRSFRRALQLLRDRLRGVHRGRLGFRRKTHEELTPTDPDALRLQSGRYSRKRSGRTSGLRHQRLASPPSRANCAMRSHNSGKEIPAAAAPWGIKLV